MSSPQRTCIGCRQVRPAAHLVRCRVRSDRSVAFGVEAARLGGRSAWLCDGSTTCVETAVIRRAFDRAWRCAVGSSVLDAIREQLTARAGEHPADITVPQHRRGDMEQWRAADPVGRAAGTKG